VPTEAFNSARSRPNGRLRVLCEKPRCARLRSRTLREAALRASTWGEPPLERAAHRPARVYGGNLRTLREAASASTNFSLRLKKLRFYAKLY
jgi:hypothetical protein